MVLEAGRRALVQTDSPRPSPGPGQVLLEVGACAVCRTDLHVIDGDLPDVRHPLVPGHEIVGRVVACGEGVSLPAGMRLGVPWLGATCGHCRFCSSGHENLCDQARFTGYQIDGGFAEFALAAARYCLPIPEQLDDVHAAPLLCAGLIGYRSLTMCGDARRLGLYGFGAAAHLVAQLAMHEGRQCYAFVRPGDATAAAFARSLGCVWAGDSDLPPPLELDAAIIFAPVGALVPKALAAVRKGGTVVCGGIHMSDIPSFPYALLWGERSLRSVANLTRADGKAFMELVAKVPLQTHVETFPLEDANVALDRLRRGDLSGAAVLVPRHRH